MVPKKKALPKERFIFAQRIKFTIFGREFNLSFNVKQAQE